MPRSVTDRHFTHVAGARCLDFVNVRLDSYDDAVAWAVSAGVVTSADARRLLAFPSGRRRAEFTALKRVRAVLLPVFDAAVRSRRPRDLRAFNRELRAVLRDVQITPELQWSIDRADLKSIRRRAMWDAGQ